MTSNFSNEAPNVVTENRFRTLMQSGYQAEVVCRSAAFRKSAVWYGEWIIRVVDQDRTFEKLLVVARSGTSENSEIRIREFKTANGLISFLSGMGCSHVNIPLHEGGRSTHVLPEDALIDNS